MAITVEIPGTCPQCGGRTCLEYDPEVPALSRLHCRPQHAGPGFCTFTRDLHLPPSSDGYVFVTIDEKNEHSGH